MNNKTLLRRSVLATILCFSAPAYTSAIAADTNLNANSVLSNNLVVESHAMDKSVDACSDFSQFANGKWLANNPIPADRASYSAYDEVTERNLIALKTIAEAAATAVNSNGAENNPILRLVGSYYQSGMNEAKIEADGAKPLATALAQIDAIQTREQLLSVIAKHHQTGTGSLFNFYVDQDAKKNEPLYSTAGARWFGFARP